MQIIETIAEIRKELARYRRADKIIGFISTLGNLHDGHISLIRKARDECDIVVAGIFLNPSHFGPGEDLEKYPRTFAEDCDRLRAARCDILFAPSVQEMYPLGLYAQTKVEVPLLTRHHCAVSRPHLFGAIATVVTKLLNIIQPDVAYFGEKDYQQLAVVKRMVETLNIPTKIASGPTIRESNGLAMSSRNNYLSEEKKNHAAHLYRCMLEAREAVLHGETDFMRLSERLNRDLKKGGFEPDYVNFAHPETLEPATADDRRVVLLAAAYLDGVRLIDNLMIERR